jgi:hypothetical protein
MLVKAQGWNKEEDHPVTAGEEHLDVALQPYQKDLAMDVMFDLSGMETGPAMDDALGDKEELPSKDAPVGESNAVDNAQEQHNDGYLGISKAQLGFYNEETGVLKAPKLVNFNDETRFGSGDTSIQMEELQDQDDLSQATNNSLATSSTAVLNKSAIISHTAALTACYIAVVHHFNSDLAAVKARAAQVEAEKDAQLTAMMKELEVAQQFAAQAQATSSDEQSMNVPTHGEPPDSSPMSTHVHSLGDYEDSGAVPSWQLHEPAIRTGFRNVTEELQEHNISTGYQAEYSSDDDSSEGSFSITLDQED